MPAWLRSLGSVLKGGRDVVLVLADEPMRQHLVEMMRPMVREVVTADQLFDAQRILECRGEQIAAAILSSSPDWGLKLRTLLAAEYPWIRRVVLIG